MDAVYFTTKTIIKNKAIMFSFLSIEFAICFIVFFCIYWTLQKNIHHQNLLLTIASYAILYLMAGALPVVILFLLSAFVIVIANLIVNSSHKKLFLWIGITTSLLNLIIFKYYNFFYETISTRLSIINFDDSNILSTIIFPLGISYYSFMAISYLVDLYHHAKNNTANKNNHLSPLQVFCHLSLFMTLTAGPIARVNDAKGMTDIHHRSSALGVQLNRPRTLKYPMLAFALILLALAKKWWIAGWLADTWVNPIFANPSQYHSLEVLVGIYAYTLQLFLDFSGYSELMIGFGLLLGFYLPVNFRAPLLAHNIRDFWNKWHISLSTWIRDYIYIPLGGGQASFARVQINLLIAMGLSGIWHGSTLNFLLWGLLHGLALVLLNCSDYLFAKINQTDIKNVRNLSTKHPLTKCLSIFLTVHFVVFCFVFFRATSFEEALVIFRALLLNHHNIAWQSNPLYTLIVMLAAWLLYPAVRKHFYRVIEWAKRMPSALIYGLLFIGFMVVVIFAPAGIPGFIYANF